MATKIVPSPEAGPKKLKDAVAKTMTHQSLVARRRRESKIHARNVQSIFHSTDVDEKNQSIIHRYVVHPASANRRYWDYITAIFIIYYSITIPLNLSFYWWNIPQEYQVLQTFIDLWFFVDILLNFRTGVIEQGVVTLNPKIIARKYIQSPWLYIDIVATLPWELIIGLFIVDISADSGSGIKTINVVQYLKLPKLIRFGRLVKGYSPYSRYKGLLKIICVFVITIHLCACLWVFMIDPCNPEVLILTDPDIRSLYDAHCSTDDYLGTLYWLSIHTIISTFMGMSTAHLTERHDLLSVKSKLEHPTSNVIKTSGLIMILGICYTALLFGNVVFLVQSLNRTGNAFRKKMDQVYYEMEYLRLPKEMQIKLKGFYDYVYVNCQGGTDSLILLNDKIMSRPLRRQVAIYAYKDLVAKIPFFKFANDDIIGRICLLLQREIYLPEEFVFKKGELGKELFIINKGVIVVLPDEDVGDDKTRKVVPVVLRDGAFFGEIGIIMDTERSRSAQAETRAELCCIQRDGFLSVLGDFPVFARNMKNLVIHRTANMFKDGSEARAVFISKLEKIIESSIKASNGDSEAIVTKDGEAPRKTICAIHEESSTGDTTPLARPLPNDLQSTLVALMQKVDALSEKVEQLDPSQSKPTTVEVQIGIQEYIKKSVAEALMKVQK